MNKNNKNQSKMRKKRKTMIKNNQIIKKLKNDYI